MGFAPCESAIGVWTDDQTLDLNGDALKRPNFVTRTPNSQR
jgi:hypothetical protein